MKSKRVVCIIQARMGSSRFPGKMLCNLCGKPMIEHIYLRARQSKLIDDVIVATTRSYKDNTLCKILKGKNISYYRGSEEDVLKRYADLALQKKADIIVRITGDCPLIDPTLINSVIKKFVHSEYDYLSPMSKCGLIRGLDVEIFSMEALKKADKLARDKASREHVTLYMYKNPNMFKIGSFKVPTKLKSFKIRLCVDEIEDYKLINKIYTCLYKKNQIIDIHDVLKLLRNNPELLEINKNIIQNKV
ncbi:glycosyltransferase family protein [Clostridiaceae bacterium M8S5]|nr:glycosyltransferase family protein [Clostridiaceae bacterium M8S5]